MHGGDGLIRGGSRGVDPPVRASGGRGVALRAGLALTMATGGLTACTGAGMDIFAAPEPGWEPRALERIAVVVLGESEAGRERIAEALSRAGRRRGVRVLPLEALLSRLPEGVVSARLDSAGPPDSAAAGAAGQHVADTAMLVRDDSARIPRYGEVVNRAFREAGIDAVLEISLDAGGRIVDPGIEHSVWDCEQWVESRGRLVCLRPREITFRGDTLYRPWASYDVRLRDPGTHRILWRGGANSTGGGYRTAREMHRDLVTGLVSEMVADGIVPPVESPESDREESGA